MKPDPIKVTSRSSRGGRRFTLIQTTMPPGAIEAFAKFVAEERKKKEAK